MYQLPLADASFDAIVIHQVLHYADRPEAAIAEAARVLRRTGFSSSSIFPRTPSNSCAMSRPIAGSALPIPMSTRGAGPPGSIRSGAPPCRAIR